MSTPFNSSGIARFAHWMNQNSTSEHNAGHRKRRRGLVSSVSFVDKAEEEAEYMRRMDCVIDGRGQWVTAG